MSKKTLEKQYQKKTQHEHILARPDMYIGTTERVTEDMWWIDDDDPENPQMKQDKLTWVPGLYKIFDEILVNAADNKVRDPDGQTKVMVTIDTIKGCVRVFNNGEGIPVAIHREHNMQIAEMIFGHLLTSSNYDDSEAKVTGGRNGFGAKLTNVFSKQFEVETCHTKSRKKFTKVWRNNMLDHDPAVVVPCDEKDTDYTQVTFYPDFAKFGMTGFGDMEGEHIVRLMKRRVYDVAACTGMKVKLNDTWLKIKNFSDYVDLFPTFGEKKVKESYARVNERWEVCIRMSNIGFQQMSFVNSIATTRGGNHVNYIANQVIEKVMADIDKKKKDKDKKASRASGVKPFMIKPHIWIFINCQIENPSFDSQTKETLNTAKPKFGSDCPLPPKILEYISKCGLVQRAVDTANSKIMREMQGKVKGTSNFLNVPKLDDAAWAGGKNKKECTLILTEGDSAKSLAIAGLGAFPRDERVKWGVFPLRGKPLNVRDATMKKVLECEEIQNLMKIIGLKVGVKYTNTDDLRYGHVMIMADQDHDGSHIKGLIVNFIHHFWPSLLEVDGFLQQFITPIVKALPGKRRAADFDEEDNNFNVDQKTFFSMPTFLEWRQNITPSQLKKYRIKYFKGLGTSSSEEGRAYFGNIVQHRIRFHKSGQACDDSIVKAFSKDKIDERKTWITSFSGANHQEVDYLSRNVSYKDFVDRELILFSIADCERSIPSLVDGFKPGQRKILYSCFKRNLTGEVKVAQLAGYVSEHSAYHHGEASLQSTIIAMAQDFVGSNNLPVLKKSGQFGTRLTGGKDSAAARYIFTSLSPVTRAIFHKDDDAILDYKDDDGFPVEPHFYVPIIPMALVNGTSGIGTGFATSVPNYSPMDIIANLRRMIDGEDLQVMTPWYRGFLGQITEKAPGKYTSTGKYEVKYDNVIRISELPIGTWTSNYAKMLKEMKEKELVYELHELNSDEMVDFGVFLHPEVHQAWTSENMLEEKLSLTSNISATNIMFFNEEERLDKYSDAEAVMREFFLVRLKYYQKRKDHLVQQLQRDLGIAENKLRFIREVTEGSIGIMRKKRSVLLEELRSRKYTSFPPQTNRFGKTEDANVAAANASEDGANPDDIADENEAQSVTGYRYLLDMPIYSLTEEMMAKLQKRVEEIRKLLKDQTEIQIRQMWKNDLDALEIKLNKYYEMLDKQASKAHQQALKKEKKSTHIEAPKRIPTMSDKARSAFMKEVEKKLPKEKKPKAKAAKKKKRKRGSDDEYSDFDSFDESDDDDDDDELAVSAAERWKDKKKVVPKATPKPKPKKKAVSSKKSKGSDDDDDKPVSKSKKKEGDSSAKKFGFDDDSFDFDGFGLGAVTGQQPPKKVSATPAAATKPMFMDEDDELLFGGGGGTPAPTATAKKPSPKPKKASPKKAAPAKKKKKSWDSDEDDFSDSSDGSSSDDSSSDDSDDDSDDDWDE